MDDDSLQPSSPRKRQKLENFPESSMAQSESTSVVAVSSQLSFAHEAVMSDPPSAADLQLQKETDVGITEFVSVETPGFTGILKKRSLLPDLRVFHVVYF